MKNKLIKVSDLKLFSLITKFYRIDFYFLQKFQKFVGDDFIDTKPSAWWYSYYDFWDSIIIFFYNVSKLYKDFIVHINYEVYNVKQDVFINSESLLLYMLQFLYFCWISLLSIILDVYKYNMMILDGGTLFAYELILLFEFWFGILSVMDELVIILYKLKSKFIFDKFGDYYTLDYLYINNLLPRLFLNNEFFDLNPWNARNKLKLLIKETLLHNNYVKILVTLGPDLGFFDERQLSSQFTFKLGEQNLFKNNQLIETFLDELTTGISYETIKFLIFNPLVNIEELREKLFKYSIYIMYFAVGQQYL